MPTEILGLTTEKAETLLQQYGLNHIQDQGHITTTQILLRQVKNNFMVYMLTIAGIVAYLVNDMLTTYTIACVILFIIGIGFIQEYRAEEAVESLKGMLMPTAIVKRNGKTIEIPAEKLVPGDIVVLNTGERVPADVVLLEGADVRSNEATLTGESKEVKKTPKETEVTQEENVLYMGTFIVNGKGLAQVIHTGMNTRFGQIAHLISHAEKELPLQKKINKLAKDMVVIAIIFAIATAMAMLAETDQITETKLIEVLVLMIAIIISAIPESFPVVLITTLAVGAKRMSQKNVIVNRMSIIETLGETTVICSDKTGTITKGEMTVKFAFTPDSLYEIGGTGYVAHGKVTVNGKKVDLRRNEHKALYELIVAGSVCNNARIERTGNDAEFTGRGNPTEIALKILEAKTQDQIGHLKGKVVAEVPFNSERKMMSVLYEMASGERMMFVKGAPERVLSKCTFMLKGGRRVKLTEKAKQTIREMQQEMAGKAFRTLIIAEKSVNTKAEFEEENLTYLGLIGLEDPPRAEVKNAIRTAQRAGIDVKMITGDNPETARAIAQRINLGDSVLTGKEIDELSDKELKIRLRDTNIFARVTPAHKIRIVRIFKGENEIVAMTGDGVNDAPALKEAHIGIAMGKTGTDVSRSAADITLKDDNFASIIQAIAEGRAIYNNIRKFVSYQLATNTAELIVLLMGVVLAPRLGWETPFFLSIQILFLNLVTDNIPAATLGLNPPDADVMREPPRKNRNIVNRSIYISLGITGSLMAIFTLLAYFVDFNVMGKSVAYARTTALLAVIIMELIEALAFKSFRKPILSKESLKNKPLAMASLMAIIGTIVIMYTPVNRVFGTEPVGIRSWLVALIISVILTILLDIAKILANRIPRYVEETR